MAPTERRSSRSKISCAQRRDSQIYDAQRAQKPASSRLPREFAPLSHSGEKDARGVILKYLGAACAFHPRLDC